jgi:hypothetical protein
MSLTCPAAQAGVFHLPLQSTSLPTGRFHKTLIKKQPPFRKEPKLKNINKYDTTTYSELAE